MLTDESYRVELLKKLPRYHRRIFEFQQIAKALTPEFELFLEKVNFALDQWFVETASEVGISRWEQEIGIVPARGDSLQARKFRIKAKLTDKIPYTDRTLEDRLSVLCGSGNYEVFRDYRNYRLGIQTHFDDGRLLETVIDTVQGMIPCNLETAYQNMFSVSSSTGFCTGAACRISERVSAGNCTHYRQESRFSICSGSAGRISEHICAGTGIQFRQESRFSIRSGSSGKVLEQIRAGCAASASGIVGITGG